MKTGHILIVGLTLTAAITATANANESGKEPSMALHATHHANVPDSTATILSCALIAPSYGVDASQVTDPTALNRWASQLGNDYPAAAAICREALKKAEAMEKSLKNDFPDVEGFLQIDESTYIEDAATFLPLLQAYCTRLSKLAQDYDSKEQARLEAERKAAEAQRRAKEEAIQQGLDQQLNTLRETILQQHRAITFACDGSSTTDKAKVKELKDLYFAYLSIYNKQDLSDTKGTDESIQRFGLVAGFQQVLLDSVVGPNAYPVLIENFKNDLKTRCGKEHSDISKSYLKVFKKTQIPAKFSNFDEFGEYIQKLRDLRNVQEAYVTVIDRRQTIAANSTAIANRCAKTHKDIESAYKETLGNVNLLPSFTSIADAKLFIDRLDEFILVQAEYLKVVDRIEAIQQRNSTIISSVPKYNADLATSFKTLVENTSFVPSFGELSGAEFFNKKLDDFEKLQECYEEIVSLRGTIHDQEAEIVASKLLPKEIIAGYKLLKSRIDFTPHFSTLDKGEEFASQMKDFIALQNKTKAINERQETIERNSKSIRSNKDCSNLVKAYDKVMKSYVVEINILSEGDMDKFTLHQNKVIAMQQRFLDIIQNGDRKAMDKQLKKEKDLDRIKLLLEI